jgi:hypothetical protein
VAELAISRREIGRRIGRFPLRHPASFVLGVALLCAVVLWFRAGRNYDSVEILTPKVIATVYSEMRVLMITVVAHGDSTWEVFHNSDIATVDAPWAPMMWPKVWGGSGEVGLVIVDAHLIVLLFVVTLVAFWLEKRWARQRLAARGAIPE